jgi:hypothetical protein
MMTETLNAEPTSHDVHDTEALPPLAEPVATSCRVHLEEYVHVATPNAIRALILGIKRDRLAERARLIVTGLALDAKLNELGRGDYKAWRESAGFAESVASQYVAIARHWNERRGQSKMMFKWDWVTIRVDTSEGERDLTVQIPPDWSSMTQAELARGADRGVVIEKRWVDPAWDRTWENIEPTPKGLKCNLNHHQLKADLEDQWCPERLPRAVVFSASYMSTLALKKVPDAIERFDIARTAIGVLLVSASTNGLNPADLLLAIWTQKFPNMPFPTVPAPIEAPANPESAAT